MKCMYCQGEMVRATAPFHVDHDDIHVIFDKVPAWVCSQCGEAYFDEPEVDSIQEFVRSTDRQAKKLRETA